MEAIRCQGLTRRFGEKGAVRSMDLAVERGEVFAFLGPNGAGKTTAVRMLAGLLQPTEGDAWVLGSDVRLAAAEIRRRIGVLTETPSLYGSLTARQNLAFFGELYDLGPARLGARVDELLGAFELGEAADRPVAGFSKGMRQRLAIARAILHDPELLFLDEPTSGLDPTAALGVREMIQQLSQEAGRTILLCTHNLDEAQRLCGRIGVISEGVLRAVGRPAELAERFWEGLWVEIELEGLADGTLRSVLREAGADGWEPLGDGVRVRVASRDEIPSLVGALAGAGARIYRVAPKEWSLADIYFRIQQGSAEPMAEGGER